MKIKHGNFRVDLYLGTFSASEKRRMRECGKGKEGMGVGMGPGDRCIVRDMKGLVDYGMGECGAAEDVMM